MDFYVIYFYNILYIKKSLLKGNKYIPTNILNYGYIIYIKLKSFITNYKLEFRYIL